MADLEQVVTLFGSTHTSADAMLYKAASAIVSDS
jgi:hypothetical protein